MVHNNDKEALDKLNQYNVQNAWFKVDFGGCPYGIFSAACPVEPLHALENGLIADCLKVLFLKIKSSNELANLDRLAQCLTRLPRQRFASSGSDKSMPRMLWKDGITTLTDLTASCKVGIMFTVVIISLREDGQLFFERVFGHANIVRDMRECFQMLLCYWMWLKKREYWRRHDRATMIAATIAIRQMLSKIITLWPRSTGQGWNLAKFHEQLHVPDDIMQNGAPKGSHSGPVEHNHIEMVKRPSKRTQKRRSSLDLQLAQRTYESFLINAAFDRMKSIEAHKPILICDRDVDFGIPMHASKGTLKIKVQDDKKQAYYEDGSMKLDIDAIQYLVDRYTKSFLETEDQEPGKVYKMRVTYYSEIRTPNGIFRAHFNYRQQYQWYDWVMIRWEQAPRQRRSHQQTTIDDDCHVNHMDAGVDQNKFSYAPGQILCFLSPEPGVYEAVVKCCEFKHSKSSIFTTKWKQAYVYSTRTQKRPYICHVDIESFVRPILMIPREDDEGIVYDEVWDPLLWADEFF